MGGRIRFCRFPAPEALHELIKASQPKAELIAFNGPHTIPVEALGNLALRLRQLGSYDPGQ